MNTPNSMIYSSNFSCALNHRLLVLDGGMGTMLQREGEIVAPVELLNINHPERITRIHELYLQAGADIITSNTFSAHALSLAEYGLSDRAEELAFAGAKLARSVADKFAEDGQERFVAGSMGPTNRSLTLDREEIRPSFEEMFAAYQGQARGLIRGGVDVLLIETIFDTMNAKAAVEGARRAMVDVGKKVDIWLSLTLADNNGRMLTGLNLTDFVRSMSYAHPAVISLNCGFGPQALLPFVAQLSEIYDGCVGFYPNAGLPDTSGNYTLSAADFISQVRPLLMDGKVGVVGGCCGTTDEHIRLLKKEVEVLATPPQKCVCKENSPSVCRVIGERCNVAGSRLFKNTIAEKRYEDAVSLALRQLEEGAWAIDINVDAPMLDGVTEMSNVLKAFASEPLLVGVPLVIDSSNWDVVKGALNILPSKVIVNSISLKDGEELFLQKARTIAAYGAGVVVMAADEAGQATTFERRMEVCKRAYDLLRDKLGFPAEDIIFDPNVLAICTGVAEHMNYGADLLRTIKALRHQFPETHIVGGLSNLSFAFRGCDPIRRALHSVFLHHAQQLGMDMVILNPSTIDPVEEIPTALRELLERAVLRGEDVTQELMDWSVTLKQQKSPTASIPAETITLTTEERLKQAILRGRTHELSSMLDELLTRQSALDIITIHLMEAMERVGELFGRGELFLPQVIRAAEVMSQVVELLQPYLPTTTSTTDKPTVVLATVKGDVHDIGKNICATLLRCNGYEVIDLGVMVEAPVILDAALKHKPDFIGLSGLITPSLSEMRFVVDACQQTGVNVPILVGGATTSAEHTARHLAPYYDAPVLWTSDASQLVILAKKLYALIDGKRSYSEVVNQMIIEQETIRCNQEGNKTFLHSLEESRQRAASLF